jgi:hypothetical protein
VLFSTNYRGRFSFCVSGTTILPHLWRFFAFATPPWSVVIPNAVRNLLFYAALDTQKKGRHLQAAFLKIPNQTNHVSLFSI